MQRPYPPSLTNILSSFHPLRNSSLCTLANPHASGSSPTPPAFSSSADSLRVLQWKMEVFEPEALNLSSLSRSILYTLSASKNPACTHPPSFVFLDTRLCDLIALIPSLVFLHLCPLPRHASSTIAKAEAEASDLLVFLY